MPRRRTLILSEKLLNRDINESLSDQIYGVFKNAIQEGLLLPGAKLPSTREISEQLGVSRPTVFASMDRLSNEGYIRVLAGSGMYIGEYVKFEPENERGSFSAPLSSYAQLLCGHKSSISETREPEIAFFPWRPAFDQFPKVEWARSLGREARNLDTEAMDHAKEPQGSQSLRKRISQFVSKYRGIDCSEDQVILTMGLNNAIDLVGRLHLDSNSQVLIEDPGYHLARKIFGLTGAVVRPGALDGEGMLVPRSKSKIALAYLTPSHQFPTGITMSLRRRLEILAWAAANNVLIAEDDYDSEYQIGSKPQPALMSLDKKGLVLYAGTFNQLMFPGLSLGYLIVPAGLVEMYVLAKQFGGEPIPQQMQNAICGFIELGELDRHIRRQQLIYAERRQVLSEELRKAFGKRVQLSGLDTGVFLLARFKAEIEEQEVIERALANGIGLVSTRVFYQNPANWPNGEYILGFGNLSPELIREGVVRLRSVFR
ncbi:MAG: PLP-dependent aminotransferase family protein [Candidatus Obscuribacterales bacterium]|nr:PLP-dependent aminotransferase family protein [Candidatus Obscuribacterales bacterium]